MAKFNIGDSVLQVATNERGRIIGVYPPRRGRQVYKVKWSSSENDELEVDLALDCDVSDPFERCKSGLWSSYADFMKVNTTFKISNSNKNTISSLKASRTLFRAYQFKPLLKFLNSDNRRLLVADEVGLGKTIEAGHIMLELQARRELKNVLIICPKSLQEKWKAELEEKFGLAFKIYHHKKDLMEDLSSHRGNVRAIVTYEKIRLPRKSKGDEQKSKPALPSLAEFINTDSSKFSLVLCDEAHKMRNAETQTYKGAELIMAKADAVVFLTATPIMISNENLYNLLHLLDKERFFNYQIFSNLISQNRPFIEALSALNRGEAFKTILQNLETSEISEYFSVDERELYYAKSTVGEQFADDPIYCEIVRLLNGEETHSSRARLQQLLSSMSVMNNIFSRTRKREVTTDMSLAQRKPHRISITLSDFEREQFDKVIDDYIDDNSYTDLWGETVMTQGGSLGLVQRKRQVASSVLAFLNSEDDLAKGIDRFSTYKDAKVDRLVEIISEVFKAGTQKIVIFGIFRRTLLYLKIRLQQKGFNSLIIHGQIKERAEILAKFKNDPEAHILLSSEVGSEGLDMQFCNSLVNYDLPWNPMVVEQRIGRIDRFGQKSPVVNIYNMVVRDSIQEIIYDRLLDRIGIFKGSIGDMEAILDADLYSNERGSIQDAYTKLEKDLFVSKLSQSEINRRIEEIEVAIERERIDIQELQRGLDNYLTNDAYFREEIDRILYNRSYVTADELRNYLEAVVSTEMPTCSLVQKSEGIFSFELPLGNKKILHNFLYKYQPLGEAYNAAFSRFNADTDVTENFTLTFDQDKAYDNPGMIYINIYHPIILACLNYLKQKGETNKITFSYSINDDKTSALNSRYFFLCVYQLRISRKVLGVNKTSEILRPLVYEVQNGAIVEDQVAIDTVYRLSQSSGKECNPANGVFTSETIDDMRYDFAEAISLIVQQMRDEQELLFRSESLRNIQQTRQYYSARIKERERQMNERLSDLEWTKDEKLRRDIEGAIRLDRYYISSQEKEMEARISAISENPGTEIKKKIVSLNFITLNPEI